LVENWLDYHLCQVFANKKLSITGEGATPKGCNEEN